jgi:peptidoglycan-N-acetylglucosamine deacetylase
MCRFICVILNTILLSTMSFAQYENPENKKMNSTFNWPNNAKVAVSISFDDSRSSQLDVGIPILDKRNVKATFYIVPEYFEKRVEEWKIAFKNGHEIASHSLVHPCSGNYLWARHKALEEYTLAKMKKELHDANSVIQQHIGKIPISFGYPCGQTFVGRGKGLKSYIPIVADMFVTGRGWMNEYSNDPTFCDLANLAGRELDGLSFDEAIALVEEAKENGHWVILAGHDIGEPDRQTVLSTTLEKLCIYLNDPVNNIWIDTVGNVGSYISENR